MHYLKCLNLKDPRVPTWNQKGYCHGLLCFRNIFFLSEQFPFCHSAALLWWHIAGSCVINILLLWWSCKQQNGPSLKSFSLLTSESSTLRLESSSSFLRVDGILWMRVVRISLMCQIRMGLISMFFVLPFSVFQVFEFSGANASQLEEKVGELRS